MYGLASKYAQMKVYIVSIDQSVAMSYDAAIAEEAENFDEEVKALSFGIDHIYVVVIQIIHDVNQLKKIINPDDDQNKLSH